MAARGPVLGALGTVVSLAIANLALVGAQFAGGRAGSDYEGDA